MKRLTESPFFQKFRKERLNETTTTTSTTTTTTKTEYKNFSSSHREEFSSSSEHQQEEEQQQQQQQQQQQFHGRNGTPKALRFTQSLQDAFHPNPMDAHFHQQQLLSNEFPPLQREPRHYQPRNIREEQKEFTEQFGDNKFTKSQKEKVFEFREQFNTDNRGQWQEKERRREDDQAVPATQQQQQLKGDEEKQQKHHFRTMAMKRTTERQFVEQRWQHSSMPPFERFRLLHTQHQTPHDLVLDRFPPQLVQSVHQLTDAAERRHERTPNSRGFSPFPVFGPFIANTGSPTAMIPPSTMLPPRQQSVPPPGTKRTAMAPPLEEMSVSMTTAQYKMPFFDQSPQRQPINLPAPMASSSGDEWQSAYEFLPPQPTKEQKVPMAPPKTAPKPQNYLSSVASLSVSPSPFDEAVHGTFNLCKLNAYSRQLATKCTWAMSDLQSEMFKSVGSIGGAQKMQQPILNESTTFSERQANDEVHKLMADSDTLPPPAQTHTSPEAQSRQSVKVEFSGPVSFLNATNLNVTNNRDIYNNYSLAETDGKCIVNRKNGRQMNDSRTDQRDKMTISPPVEQYIESVCDLGPIFAEIGQTLTAQNQPNFVLTPTGNIQRRAEERQRETTEETFSYRIGAIDLQQSTAKRRTSAASALSNVPYLVHSSSQCTFARVSAICQKWRLARAEREESAECVATITIRRTQTTIGATFFAVCCNLPHKKSIDLPQNACAFSAASFQNAKDNNATVSQRTKYHHSKYGTMPYMSMHRTQSADRAAMETTQWWQRHDDAEDALRSTLMDVQREQAAARAYSKRFQCAEEERIERAILTISEGLRRPMPVSKAHAEVKEELLRVRLAQLILNLDPDNDNNNNKNMIQFATEHSRPFSAAEKRLSSDTAPSHEYTEALRAPIALLREKLRLLEHRLMYEDADCIGTELRRISATPPLLRSEEQRRRHEALSVRSGEIARMTPLIGMLQHKLSTLDDACTRREYAEQEQHQQQMNHRMGVNEFDSQSAPYTERKTVHELLKRISGEIETIHELCRRDEVRDRLDAVLAVLKRVATSVDQITATLDRISRSYQQKQQQKNMRGEEEQRKRVMDRTEENSALIEERQQQHRRAEENEEDVKMFKSSKFEKAIKHRQEEALARTEHKKRTEQLMKEMVGMFKEEKWQNQREEKGQTKTNIGKMREDNQQQTKSLGQHQQHLLLSTNQQWVHAVELSANFVRHPTAVAFHVQAIVLTTDAAAQSDYAGSAHPTRFQQCAIELNTANEGEEIIGNLANAEKGTGGKDRAYDRMKKRRFDQQMPRIVRQPNMPSILQYDEFDSLPAFKLGACPPSYLSRDEMPNRPIQQQPFQYQLEVPTKVQQQPKFLQLHQQNYYLCSSQDDEEEEDEMTASSASALDSSSLNVPILFRKKLSMCSEPTRETAILTDEEENPEENINEVFFLRRRRKHSMLNAIIYPETKMCLRASLRHGNNFEIVVERVSDCGRDSVVMVSEEFYDKRVLIRSGSPVRHSTVMEEMESSDEGQPTASSSPGILVDAHTKMAVSISARSDRDSVHVFLEEIPCGQIGLQVQAPFAPSSLSLAAIPTPNITTNNNKKNNNNYGMDSTSRRSPQSVGAMANSSEGRDSVFREVKVSGGGELESLSRSLRSSRRSSQKSLLAISEGAEEEGQAEEIPAYVIKKGSTASITCELNGDCVEFGAKIEWFRGQNEQIVPFGDKFERNREGWVELLVISDVQPEDAQLYSVKINGKLYPVAYLIVEEHNDNDEMEGSTPSGQTVVDIGPEPQFLTAPQTQFVLQGETAILSVQMNRANLDVIWHKDGQILDVKSGGKCADGRPRIWQEETTTGWYRIIVNDVQFADQGFYFAQFGEQQTNVQLIVEERIDEREVQVSSAETDDEELGDYLVPFGSTATIACELENVSFGYKLHWQRNHKDLDYEISCGDGKFEHVVNRAKHYLIIHNAQPEDSGVYSVRIGDAMFKVAQITIGTELGQQNLSGSRIRRISSQSLTQSVERDGQQQNANRRAK